MTPEKLINEIRDFCTENRSEENKVKFGRFFKEGFNGYGIESPKMKEKVKELLQSKTIDFKTIINAAPELIESKLYEESAIILLLLDGYGKEYTKKTFEIISGWFAFGIYNWAHADILGMYILPQFMKKEILVYTDFQSWIFSPYKFQRRCVPVTFIKHFKANKQENFTKYFEFLELLMTDPEREVHQGMGWFLREAWKIQPTATEKFLMKWKNSCPRLIINYSTEKMDKSYKEKFRKEKSY